MGVRCVVLAGSEPAGGWLRELKGAVSVETLAISSLGDQRVLERVLSFDAIVLDASSLAPEQLKSLTRELATISLRNNGNKIVAVVDSGDEETARRVVEAGAWEVIAPDAPEDLVRTVHRAAQLHRLYRDAVVAAEDAAPDPAVNGEPEYVGDEPVQMIGTSEPMRQVFALIRRVASLDLPVLITGESGTGKELAALGIHERSSRREGPFVAINCSAIPESLLEAELFGHEKGAFTGAVRNKRGRFELAQGGTILLDEIGEMPPLLQVKLLRFLEDHIVEPLGGSKRIALDVRVIAATNRDLSAAVERGEFREDLYFRLAVFTIHLPPLRERGEDAVVMAEFFLRSYAKETGRPAHHFTPEAIDAILEARWKGNVRELINRVRRAVVLADSPYVTPTDLGFEIRSAPAQMTLREARRQAEIRMIRQALRRANYNKAEAAHALGISRTQLYELMSRYGIPAHEWG